MEQTKYQKTAMDYSKEYLDKLLDLESYVGQKLGGRIDKLIEEKIEQRMRELSKGASREQTPDGTGKE